MTFSEVRVNHVGRSQLDLRHRAHRLLAEGPASAALGWGRRDALGHARSRSHATPTPTFCPALHIRGSVRDGRHPFPALLVKRRKTRFRETATALGSP